MTNGIRVLRDILWIVVWVAGAVAVYRAFSGAAEATMAANAVMGLGAVCGLILFALSLIYKTGDAKTKFNETSGTWVVSMGDTASRVTALAVIALPFAAGLLHAGVMDGKIDSFTVMAPKAEDEMRTVLRLDGDRDGDVIVFKHEMHKQLAGGDDGCVKCHHLNKPGDPNSNCNSCHSDMNQEASVFDHNYHQAKLGDTDSCDQCHESAEPRSALSAKACFDCHGENMGMKKPADGKAFNVMASPYPNAMHGACVDCHREKANSEGMGCLACCDTCHQAVNHEDEELKVR